VIKKTLLITLLILSVYFPVFSEVNLVKLNKFREHLLKKEFTETDKMLSENKWLLKAKGIFEQTTLEWILNPRLFTNVEVFAVYLVKKGATVNEEYAWGDTPLIRAVNANYLELCREIIKKGSKVNIINDSGMTPLDYAKEIKNEAITNLLIKNGAKDRFYSDIPEKIKNIVSNKNVELMTKMIKKDKTLLNFKDFFGRSLLYWMLTKHNRAEEELIITLIENGASINESHHPDRDLIMKSIERNYKKVAKLLFKKGVKLECRHVIKSVKLDNSIANFIINNSNLKNNFCYSEALMASAYNGNLKITKLLIEKGASLEFKNVNERTPLMKAVAGATVKHNSLEVVEFLLEKGANVNASDKFGLKVIDCAEPKNKKDLIKLLIENGAEANWKRRMEVGCGCNIVL